MKKTVTILYSCILFFLCLCMAPVTAYGKDKQTGSTQYHIELNAAGGTISDSSSITVDYSSDSDDVLDLSKYKPDRSGYTFTGWYSGSRRITTVSKYSFSADSTSIKLTAVYTKDSFAGDGLTFILDANGGSINGSDSVTCDFEAASGTSLYGYAPTRDGYDLTGWNTKSDGSGSNVASLSADDFANAESKGFEYSDVDGTENTRCLHLYASWAEAKAPSGSITIGENSWSSLQDNPGFDIYSSKALSASISCDPATATVRYIISRQALDSDSLGSQTFTDYSGSIYLPTGGQYIIYAQLTSQSGKTSYLSSSGVVVDGTAPVISGIKDGAIYCVAATATIKDSEIAKVYIGKEEVTPDDNHQIVIPGAKGKQTITATDKAGNSTKITITVNKDHTAKTVRNKCQTYKVCKYCKEQLSTPKTSHTALKKHAAVKATTNKTGNIEYWYCSDCGKYFSDKKGTNEINKKDTVTEKLPATEDSNSNNNNNSKEENTSKGINEVSEMTTASTTETTTQSTTASTTQSTTQSTTSWSITTAFATTEIPTISFTTTETEDTTASDEISQTTTEKSSDTNSTTTRYQNPESESAHSKVHNLTLVILLTVIITILVAFVIIIISGLKDGRNTNDNDNDDDDYDHFE